MFTNAIMVCYDVNRRTIYVMTLEMYSQGRIQTIVSPPTHTYRRAVWSQLTINVHMPDVSCNIKQLVFALRFCTCWSRQSVAAAAADGTYSTDSHSFPSELDTHRQHGHTSNAQTCFSPSGTHMRIVLPERWHMMEWVMPRRWMSNPAGGGAGVAVGHGVITVQVKDKDALSYSVRGGV